MRDFNFFAPFQGEKKQSVNKKIYIYTIGVVIGVLVVGSLSWNVFNLFKLKHDIDKYNETINSSKVQEKVKKADEVNKKLDVLAKYNEGLTQVSSAVDGRSVIKSEVLEKINDTLPQEVSFRSINIDGNNIAIQGVSKNRTAIGELEYNVKQLDFISDAQVGSINSDGADGTQYSFDLKCTLGVSK